MRPPAVRERCRDSIAFILQLEHQSDTLARDSATGCKESEEANYCRGMFHLEQRPLGAQGRGQTCCVVRLEIPISQPCLCVCGVHSTGGQVFQISRQRRLGLASQEDRAQVERQR
jgi:hypothetical protein